VVVKFHHREGHVARLRQVCEDYRRQRPYYVEAEPIAPDRVEYRLHIRLPTPPIVPLIVGDILHNLRSALDSIGLGLVQHDQGRVLDEQEQKACQFPICERPREFKHSSSEMTTENAGLSDRVQGALRVAQPFYRDELALKHGYIELARCDENAERNDLS
jgi:hypothetical protein